MIEVISANSAMYEASIDIEPGTKLGASTSTDTKIDIHPKILYNTILP